MPFLNKYHYSKKKENIMSDTAENTETPEENTTPEAANDAAEQAEQTPKEPRSQDVMELDGMIDGLEEKLDKVMRAYADAENRAKRAEKERSDALKYGASKMARDLLEVADNLGRAVSSMSDEQKEQLKEVVAGIELTEKNLIQVFERHDIKRVETTGKFDPNKHEAVTQVPMPDKESGDIIDVIRQGYIMGERLLRPAQVVVCQ